MDAPQETESVHSVEEENKEDKEPKPKRTLNEAQLRNLAIGRKAAIEARKKKAILNKANKLQAKEEYEEAVEEAKQTVEKLQPKYTRKTQPIAPPEPAPTITPPQPPPRPKSAKETYYEMKLRLLQEQEEERKQASQWHQQYAKAPSSVHAADIARQALVNRANKAVMERAYREIFPDG